MNNFHTADLIENEALPWTEKTFESLSAFKDCFEGKKESANKSSIFN